MYPKFGTIGSAPPKLGVLGASSSVFPTNITPHNLNSSPNTLNATAEHTEFTRCINNVTPHTINVTLNILNSPFHIVNVTAEHTEFTRYINNVTQHINNALRKSTNFYNKSPIAPQKPKTIWAA
jgi:ribosome-associated translation inhibitor RaiA